MRATAWETLRHAAGPADDVPAALASLHSEDEDERDFAVNWIVETLFEDEKGAACIHSATLPAALALAAFVAEETPSIEETQAEIADVLGDLYGRFSALSVPEAAPLLKILAPFAAS